MFHPGEIDMLTTIIIGNTETYIKGKYMITPRGYKGLPSPKENAHEILPG